jgi:MauM/NapG family ferredoxin protein
VEFDFLAACTRCGQCVAACPFDTLTLIPGVAGPRVATPTFDPVEVPCYLCQGHDELECIAVCPTEALSPVASERDIRIGTAEILHDHCFAYNGVLCRSCWHACPFPDEAIVFDERLRPIVVEESCIGCGLCTRACPTAVNAIPVRPRATT